jgi:hypothetical protein
MTLPPAGTPVVVTAAMPLEWPQGRRGVVHADQLQAAKGRLHVLLDEPIRPGWSDIYADRWHLAQT